MKILKLRSWKNVSIPVRDGELLKDFDTSYFIKQVLNNVGEGISPVDMAIRVKILNKLDQIKISSAKELGQLKAKSEENLKKFNEILTEKQCEFDSKEIDLQDKHEKSKKIAESINEGEIDIFHLQSQQNDLENEINSLTEQIKQNKDVLKKFDEIFHYENDNEK